MGRHTGIAWTDHTFNPWRGCTKVSAGCANCYAETMSRRNPAVLGEWGPTGKRALASEAYWRQPLAWNRAAENAGERRKVFCASLADVFEDREELLFPRACLFDLIARTPALDWLLLTKRPENIIRLWPGASVEDPPMVEVDGHLVFPNVWLGVSVEDQATADARIPDLLDTPAALRFVSYEPALGPVRFDRVPGLNRGGSAGQKILRRCWVIVGGESGPKARPFDVAWAQSVVEQCRRAGVPVFVKQLGSYPILDPRYVRPGATRWLRDRAGADPEEWPIDLRGAREFPR